ncbi:MAG TPA: ATP-binding protein, partial [Methylophilaceae bacterium]|nr:ATP-binding protein [Methylophilaceae bacterium]
VAGEMAAAMSHEVRTPLGILRSSAQLLLRQPNLSDEAREVCGFIISETERLNKLVSTLIDTARPRTPEFSATDIAELVQQTAAMLRAQVQKKHILLNFEINGPAIAWCDAEQITQVMLNLLLNAIQVLPEGGRIVVSVWSTPELVMATIADNGPGIPPELYDRIFDPFFTQREGGIGLGLAVVRQIVLAHHGNISVGSSGIGGAEFRLELPAAETMSE